MSVDGQAASPPLAMTARRDIRALSELLAVYEFAPGMYWVYSEEGREYTVDAETGSCTCPDAQYNEPTGGCKHARRVALWRGDKQVPEWVNLDAVDPLLIEQIGLTNSGHGGVESGIERTSADD